MDDIQSGRTSPSSSHKSGVRPRLSLSTIHEGRAGQDSGTARTSDSDTISLRGPSSASRRMARRRMSVSDALPHFSTPTSSPLPSAERGGERGGRGVGERGGGEGGRGKKEGGGEEERREGEGKSSRHGRYEEGGEGEIQGGADTARSSVEEGDGQGGKGGMRPSLRSSLAHVKVGGGGGEEGVRVWKGGMGESEDITPHPLFTLNQPSPSAIAMNSSRKSGRGRALSVTLDPAVEERERDGMSSTSRRHRRVSTASTPSRPSPADYTFPTPTSHTSGGARSSFGESESDNTYSSRASSISGLKSLHGRFARKPRTGDCSGHPCGKEWMCRKCQRHFLSNVAEFVQDADNELEEMREEMEEKTRDLTEAHMQLQNAGEDREVTDANMERMKKEGREKDEKISILEEDVNRLKATYATACDVQDQLRVQNDELRARLAVVESLFDRSTAAVTSTSAKLDEERRRRQNAREEEERTATRTHLHVQGIARRYMAMFRQNEGLKLAVEKLKTGEGKRAVL